MFHIHTYTHSLIHTHASTHSSTWMDQRLRLLSLKFHNIHVFFSIVIVVFRFWFYDFAKRNFQCKLIIVFFCVWNFKCAIFFLFISISKQQNDDEAERAQRRRTFGKSSVNTTQTSDSLVEEQQGLQNCLKIFHDNVSHFYFSICFFLHTIDLIVYSIFYIWIVIVIIIKTANQFFYFIFFLFRKSVKRMRGHSH